VYFVFSIAIAKLIAKSIAKSIAKIIAKQTNMINKNYYLS